MTEETNNIGVFKAPSDIHFMGYEKATNSLMLRSSVELMRMSRDGIWVNPDIPVDETAKQVLEILDNALKNMVRIAVEEERDACAKEISAEINDEIEDEAYCILVALLARIHARADG